MHFNCKFNTLIGIDEVVVVVFFVVVVVVVVVVGQVLMHCIALHAIVQRLAWHVSYHC
jgi:hypothetical protein